MQTLPERDKKFSAVYLLAGSALWWAGGAALSGITHNVYSYHAVPAPGMPAEALAFLAALACGLAGFGLSIGRAGNAGAAHAGAAWLAAAGAGPLVGIAAAAQGCRWFGFAPLLWHAWCTYRAALRFAAAAPESLQTKLERVPWRAVTLCLLALAAAWWIYESAELYASYLFGYQDFGLFARRLHATLHGGGFLCESPWREPFWDHFNPGLALLLPLWALWPSAYLLMCVQAACLAAGGLGVWSLARAHGARPPAAAAWTLAYAFYPPLTQLPVTFGYGFHVVSLALPPLLFAFAALARRQRGRALLWLAAACLFKEEIFILLAGLCSAMALRPEAGTAAENFSRRKWLLLALTWAALFALCTSMTGTLAHNQRRFSAFGSTAAEVLISPLLRPAAFWGQMLQPRNLCFLLLLALPVGLGASARNWRVALALALPLGTLCAWSFAGATSIALQYPTSLTAFLFAAAIGGWAQARKPADSSATVDPLLPGGAAALAACLTTGVFVGLLPWSQQSVPFQTTPKELAARAWHARELDLATERLNRPEVTVVATRQLAAHLLAVKRLEVVEEALDRKTELTKEAGSGLPWIRAFEWVAVDLHFRDFNQPLDQARELSEAAEAAEYVKVYARHGLLLLHAPDGSAPTADPLEQWRAPGAYAGERTLGELAPGIMLVSLSTHLAEVDGRTEITGEAVLRAETDYPPECDFEYAVCTPRGERLASTGRLAPVSGCRPTSWWKRGETWRVPFRLSCDRLPAGIGVQQQALLHPAGVTRLCEHDAQP